MGARKLAVNHCTQSFVQHIHMSNVELTDVLPHQLAPGVGRLTARGESVASHRDGRGASRARRDDREYREYLREEQRSPRGCIACRMQPDFHHGLLGSAGAHEGGEWTTVSYENAA